MKKYLFTAALILTPVMAMAEHPEGDYVNDIKSEIRDDYRQLHEDRDAGYTQGVRDDERQIAEDKIRLSEAIKHPHREAMPPTHYPDKDTEHRHDEMGDQVNAAPPVEHPESDEWKQTSDKIDPDRPFNHAAHVDNEIR